MTATLPLSTRQQTQQVVLEGITWQTYQALLENTGDHRASRFAYEQGILEIIMPSTLHEIINRLLALMVTTLAEELNLRIRNYGSTTLNREDLAHGVEPDSCFYIQRVDQVIGKSRPGRPETKLNLKHDPPPDLAVEVDITSSSRRRFGIYLKLGISETWRYTEQRGVIIYQLQNGEYVECEFSPTFPMISGAVLAQFLQLAETEDDIAVIRALRQWVRNL